MLMRKPRCLAYVTNEIAIYCRRKHGRIRFIPAHSFDLDVHSFSSVLEPWFCLLLNLLQCLCRRYLYVVKACRFISFDIVFHFPGVTPDIQ